MYGYCFLIAHYLLYLFNDNQVLDKIISLILEPLPPYKQRDLHALPSHFPKQWIFFNSLMSN